MHRVANAAWPGETHHRARWWLAARAQPAHAKLLTAAQFQTQLCAHTPVQLSISTPSTAGHVQQACVPLERTKYEVSADSRNQHAEGKAVECRMTCHHPRSPRIDKTEQQRHHEN